VRGNLALVGAIEGEAAYLFIDDGMGWSFDKKLTANNGSMGDLFGRSVGLNDETAIIGAHQDNPNGQFSGSAYLFNASTGNQVDKISAFDGAQFDSFGYSVAIDDDMALVGANFDSTTDGIETGSAYLFNAIQAADFDEDSDVDGQDLADWQGGLGMLNPGHMDGDADLDGDVEGIDFLTWQRQFEPPALATSLGQVPGPSTLYLVLTAAVLLSQIRRAA